VLGEVLAQDVADPARSSWVATRQAHQQLALASVGTSETTQRTARRSNSSSTARCHGVLLGEDVAVQHVLVLAPRLGRQRAAQHEHVARRRGVLALGAAELLDLAARAAALAHALGTSSRVLELPPHVAGDRLGRGPATADAGSIAASLRIEARACSVSWLKARGARAAGPWRPVRGRACRSSR
jgi:hypothetical protein